MLNDGEGGGVGLVVVVVCGECRVGGEPSACSVEADSGGWGGESDGGGGFAGCEAFPDGQGEEFSVGLVQLGERGVDGVVGGGVGGGVSARGCGGVGEAWGRLVLALVGEPEPACGAE